MRAAGERSVVRVRVTDFTSLAPRHPANIMAGRRQQSPSPVEEEIVGEFSFISGSTLDEIKLPEAPKVGMRCRG